MARDNPVPSSAATGIGGIPTLPVFFKLRGRRVVLAGGSQPAVWKAELLAAAGAHVHIFAPTPCFDLTALAGTLAASLTMHLRDWSADDLAGAAIAIGALQAEEAESFRAATRRAGVPVNIIDVPELCDFQFGTIVERSPLLIAISTDGAAPVFGQALRARIEALLPEEVTAWAQAAKDWRPDLQARSLSFSARRRFWEVFADRALSNLGGLPTEADRQACLSAALIDVPQSNGALDLVGLGPGEADLVTLRAIRTLQSADVIVHPVAISPTLIRLGRREAQRIPELADDGMTYGMIERLLEKGKRVVWTARGDPLTCEDWQARRRAVKIQPRSVVPGLRCEACPKGCNTAT